ncbi:MAG: ATP-dependent Clp protease ATP-binding subunit, partial [Clostridia bacterium]|nr:ATP-dependent Clp protease ATP-binding subunit [Clostridia bacterium]
YTIQRPELLNRIGDNFVVFDFIREAAAAQILDLKLNAIANNLEHEKGVKLTIGDGYRNYLLEKALADLSNGGRGIGNMVETYLINPLSSVLIMEKWDAGSNIEIQSPVTDADRLPFEYAITY